MLPPFNYDEAQKFCCCQPYSNYHICIYAGGGSRNEHDMYWGFIIYDSEGYRRHDGRLPDSCLDVDDGMSHCQRIIDIWNQGITYEDVYLWRAICEYLWLVKGKSSHYDPMHPSDISQIIPNCQHLIGLDRTHREILWDKYKIQLITWTKATRHHEGWCLKGNWEDKIDFLEQVYILETDPGNLPRPWLDKWQRKQQQQKFKVVDKHLKSIIFGFECLQRSIEWDLGEEQIRNNLNGITEECREAREAIVAYFMDLRKNDK